VALLELSVITGTLAQMGLEKAFDGLNRREAVIRARKRIGMAAAPDPGNYQAIYRHALVEWGISKPETVLDFFRDQRIYDAFIRSYQRGDPTILRNEAAEVVHWAEEYGAFRGLEYDPRRELLAFTATFEEVVDYARTAVEVRQDLALARLEQRLDEIQRLLAQLQAGQIAIGDIHLSGDFSGSIVNLLSQLGSATQTVAPVRQPPSLPPLDERGRPPLPDPGPLPPGHRLPYDRNPLFTGREEELRAIARAVLYAPAALPAVISTGIGGVGKTQLAVEFAYRYGRYFHGAHWVSLADPNPDVIAAEMVACGLAMGLWPPEQDAALTTGEKLDRIRRTWAGPEPRLVIFDNCEDRALLEEWRPRGGGARALVTSRDDTWPAGYQRLPVRTLPRAESRSLLREYLDPAGRAEPDAALDAVAETLGDLPLALILAGSTLSAYPELTVERYLADLDQPDLLRRLLPDEDARPASWTKHDLDVARTFALGLERLRPDDGTDADARLMLAAATCLIHGEPFPRALLTGILPGDDPRPAGRAVNRLLALGLLERSGAETLRLHRLPARFAAGALAEGMDTARAAVEEAVIDLAYEQNMAGDPRRLRAWESHLRHVVDAAFDREDETAATLCANLGFYLKMIGDLAGARPYFEQALAISERVLGPEHPDTALNLNNLGSLLKAMGDLAGARPYYERALAISERVLGPDHPQTAGSLNNLGSLLQAMGDLAGARPYYEQALAIRERVLGSEHQTAAEQAATALSLNNLGSLLQDMGDLAGARPYLERALAIRERVLGSEHPDTATSLNNLGGLLQDMGDLTGARPYLERALAISERVLGPEHPNTATSLNNLAILCYYEEDFAAAAGYMRRAVAIREKVLGPQHPSTRKARESLSVIEARL